MKREAITHTKTKRLCRRLDLPTWQAVGLLDSIWHLAARQTPRGDLGKLSDEDIALGIDYRGDAAAMLLALAETRWIDAHPEHRYVIHDWPDHCEDSVHMRLARARQFFADGRQPKLTRLPGKEKEAAETFYNSCAQTARSCAQPDDPCARPESVHTPDTRRASHLDLDHHHHQGQDLDPALTPPGDSAARERSLTDHEPSQNGKAENTSSRSDDDERTTRSPWEEIRHRYRSAQGADMSAHDASWLREQMELRNVGVGELLKLVDDNPLNGFAKGPMAGLKWLVKKFGTKAAKAAAAPVRDLVVPEAEKCPECGSRRGEGLLLGDRQTVPCPCATAEFIARMQAKGILAKGVGLKIVKARAAS